MVFSSIAFLLFFFPFFLTIYFIVGARFKNLVLLLASIFFYSWGAPRFIFILLGTTFVDFHLVKFMHNTQKKPIKKVFLVLSLCMNLGLLFYYKYSFFMIENVNTVLQVGGIHGILWKKLILPVGISFFTFESLTYVIDVYQGFEPLKKFWNYQVYIILFPKLIAGPIIRYHDISDQISGRLGKENIDDFIVGLFRFIIGLSKKLLIANCMGFYADKAFNSDIHSLSTLFLHGWEFYVIHFRYTLILLGIPIWPLVF